MFNLSSKTQLLCVNVVIIPEREFFTVIMEKVLHITKQITCHWNGNNGENKKTRPSFSVASNTLTDYLSIQHAAVQTAKSSHPRALHRVWLWGASQSRGAGGTHPPGQAHQEPPGQIQVDSTEITTLELGWYCFWFWCFTFGIVLVCKGKMFWVKYWCVSALRQMHS